MIKLTKAEVEARAPLPGQLSIPLHGEEPDPMSDFTQPLCVACWHGDQPPHRMQSAKQVERCCRCGRPTSSGIYIRVDPATVPYPTEDDD